MVSYKYCSPLVPVCWRSNSEGSSTAAPKNLEKRFAGATNNMKIHATWHFIRCWFNLVHLFGFRQFVIVEKACMTMFTFVVHAPCNPEPACFSCDNNKWYIELTYKTFLEYHLHAATSIGLVLAERPPSTVDLHRLCLFDVNWPSYVQIRHFVWVRRGEPTYISAVASNWAFTV